MSMHLGRIAYGVWVQKRRELNLPSPEFSQLRHVTAEAWQAVGEEIARQCGVDPAVFEAATEGRPNEATGPSPR